MSVPDTRVECGAIPIDKFGKDHWSTFAYLETLVVDKSGDLSSVASRSRMRTDSYRHPVLSCMKWTPDDWKKYPTRLKDGELAYNHDDWDCAYDLESAGLIKLGGTGINMTVSLTDKGFGVASLLRRHIASKKPVAMFDYLS